MNRSPSIAIKLKTPIEVWSDIPTDYSTLKIFDYPIYTYVSDSKLGKKIQKYIFLSFQSEVKGYILWCIKLDSQKFIVSRDVTFNEKVMLHSRKESIVIDKDHNIDE